MGQNCIVIRCVLDATAVQCQLVGVYGDSVVVRVALYYLVGEDYLAPSVLS